MTRSFQILMSRLRFCVVKFSSVNDIPLSYHIHLQAYHIHLETNLKIVLNLKARPEKTFIVWLWGIGVSKQNNKAQQGNKSTHI